MKRLTLMLFALVLGSGVQAQDASPSEAPEPVQTETQTGTEVRPDGQPEPQIETEGQAQPQAEPRERAQTRERVRDPAAGRVARAIVASGVSEREPVDDLTELGADVERAFFFTELRGMAGETITHRWSHGGEVQAEVVFSVGGPRWRVWSSKEIMAHQQGEWQLEVLDAAGNVLEEKRFQYHTAP